jgi:hypothetical protein
MNALPLLLACALHASEAEPAYRLEHAFDTITNGYYAAYSGDGRTAVVWNSVWDLETGTQKGLISGGGAAVAFSRDAALGLGYSGETKGLKKISERPDYVVESHSAGELLLWDTVKDKKVRRVAKLRFDCKPTGSGFQPTHCPNPTGSFSPDGKRFVYNVPDGPWRQYKENGPSGFRRDGWKSFVASVEGGSPKELEGGGYAEFVGDGRLLRVLFRMGMPQQVVDGDTGERVSFLRDGGEQPIGIGFTPDGRYLASVAQWPHLLRYQVWETATGKLLVDRSVRNPPSGSSVLMGGRWLLHGDSSANKPLALFDLDAGGAEAAAPPFPGESYFGLSPDGRFFTQRNKAGVLSFHRVVPAGAPAAAPKPGPAAAANVDAPPAAKTPLDPDAYAVVIGVEKYRQEGIPKVDFAARDAETVKRYLTESMGFDAANVVLLRDEGATKTDLEKHLGPWLKNRVTPKSRVFVYYAGHGAPNPATGKGFLIPYEGDPNYTEVTAYPIQSLYDALAALPAKDVTVVLDACFSGVGGRSLLAKGARPLVNAVAARAGGNTTVLSAASGAQVSASFPEKRHGLLTYFLLEGLHGSADADKDGAVTTAELHAYARPAVEREARKQNLEQTPALSGPGTAVWLRR